MKLYKAFVLNEPVKMNTWGGRLEVSCGDLVLSFPEPEEADRDLWLYVRVPVVEVNFDPCQPLCHLPEQPRPKNQEEGLAAIKAAVRAFGAALSNI